MKVLSSARSALAASRRQWREAGEQSRAEKRNRPPMSGTKLFFVVLLVGWVLYALISAGHP